METGLWIHQHLKIVYENLCAPVLQKYKLTKLEMDILAFLADNPTFNTASLISEKMNVKKSNVSTSIDHLSKRNMIEIIPSTTDRRVHHLHICGEHEVMLSEIKNVLDTYRMLIMSGLTEAEIDSVNYILMKMLDNITGYLHKKNL